MSDRNKIIKVELTEGQHAYLTEVLNTGIYGSTKDDVIKHFVIRGLEEVIKAGLILSVKP